MFLEADIDALRGLAANVADLLESGDAVLLDGELGAGKTEFARALLRRFCGDPFLEVPSPSFSLVQAYEGARGPIAHLDLYRLSGEGDLQELGWDELRCGIVLVEWPERLRSLEPAGGLWVKLGSSSDPEHRRLTLSGWTRNRLQRLERGFIAG